MSDVVIIEAVRTPSGKRGGGLSTMHAADLLAVAQRAVVERSGIDPGEVDQLVGGCISQVGMQAFNTTRTAWLSAGFPITTEPPPSTASAAPPNRGSASPPASWRRAPSTWPSPAAWR